jgi:hypothetical protein
LPTVADDLLEEDKGGEGQLHDPKKQYRGVREDEGKEGGKLQGKGRNKRGGKDESKFEGGLPTNTKESAVNESVISEEPADPSKRVLLIQTPLLFTKEDTSAEPFTPAASASEPPKPTAPQPKISPSAIVPPVIPKACGFLVYIFEKYAETPSKSTNESEPAPAFHRAESPAQTRRSEDASSNVSNIGSRDHQNSPSCSYSEHSEHLKLPSETRQSSPRFTLSVSNSPTPR